MAFINVQVTLDGSDITEWVISYNREHVICTGISSLEMYVPMVANLSPNPWDEIIIWENGDKRATFYVSSVTDVAERGVTQIMGQDNSKRLTDYFVTDTYTIDYLSYSKYWIDKFLDEAGVPHSFSVGGEGTPLSNNTSLGLDSAYNIILTLLQQSGWYIFFDEDGHATIGDLNKDMSDPDHSVSDSDLVNLTREKDDERLRNRAVVWGNTNPAYGQVFVDISVQTPYNYDADDKRAVVLANSAILSNDTALALAQKLLNEFTKIKDEKALILANDHDIDIGDTVRVSSRFWTGTGLATTVTASMSQDGLIYTIILDEKCPRMFTFFGTFPPTISGFPVYIGTDGDGVKKRWVNDTVWYDQSSGLENTFINDLFIRDNVFATVAADGYLYTRASSTASWAKFHPGTLRDINGNEFPEEALHAVACSINDSNNIVAAFTTQSGIIDGGVISSGVLTSGILTSGVISWILEVGADQHIVKAEQIKVDSIENSISLDVEAAGEYNIVSAYLGDAVPSGYNLGGVQQARAGNLGHREIQIFSDPSFSFPNSNSPLPPDNDSYAYGPQSGAITVPIDSMQGSTGGGTIRSGIIVDEDYNLWFMGAARLVKMDTRTRVTTNYNFTTPTEWNTEPFDDYILFFRQRFSNLWDIVCVYPLSGPGAGGDFRIRHHTLNTDTLTISLVSVNDHITTSPDGTWYIGAGMIGVEVVIYHIGRSGSNYEYRVTTYNVQAQLMSTTNFLTTTFGFAGFDENETKLISSGNKLIATVVYKELLNPITLTECGAFPPSGYLTVRVYAAYFSIDKFGVISSVNNVLIDEFNEVPEHYVITYGNDTIIRGSSVVGPEYTALVGLGNAYTRVVLLMEMATCIFPDDYLYRGISYYLKWPGPSVVRKIDTGNITYADSYDDSTGAQGLIKNANSSTIGVNWQSYGAYFGRYGPIYYTQRVDLTTGGESWNIIDARTGLVASSVANLICCGNDVTAIDDVDNTMLRSRSSPSPEAPFLNLGGTMSKALDPPSKFSGSQYFLTQDFIAERASSAVRIWFYDLVLPPFTPVGILKHTSTSILEGVTATDLAEFQTQGIFETIYLSTFLCKVEISKGAPTVVYSVPQTIGEPGELVASLQNTYGSFYDHAIAKGAYDARVFDLLYPSQFVAISGFTETEFERYIGIANEEGLLASKYDLTTPWVTMTAVSGVVASGIADHLETTNFVPSGTYIFYSIKDNPYFFQRNPGEAGWRNYSSGLPVTPITCIRVDDFI